MAKTVILIAQHVVEKEARIARAASSEGLLLKVNASVNKGLIHFFAFTNKFLACDPSCRTCVGPSPSSCTSCDPPKVLVDRECISTMFFSIFPNFMVLQHAMRIVRLVLIQAPMDAPAAVINGFYTAKHAKVTILLILPIYDRI